MKFRMFLEMDTKLDYHEELNPKIWKLEGDVYVLDAKVKEKLHEIAKKFIEFLKLTSAEVTDYVITGSNANYNWTSLSDIDLHVLVDDAKVCICKDCTVDPEDCLLAKKSLWNDRHDIEIYGHRVELYATTEGDKLIGDSGTYSLMTGKWLKQPEKKQISLDSEQISAKADEIAHEIDQMISTKSEGNEIQELLDKIAKMRKSGLERAGEFSVENLVFKALRNNGYIDKIRKYSVKAADDELSLK